MEANQLSPLIKWSDKVSHKETSSTLPDFVLLEDSVEESQFMNVGETTFNLCNTLIGSGVLSIPYAFKLSGYLTLPLLLVVVGVTGLTAIFIGEALDRADDSPVAERVERRNRDYTFLAEAAFGKRGRLLVGVVTPLEMWLATVTFLVMNGVNAHLLLGIDVQTAVICGTVLGTLLVPVPLRVYAYVSLFSLVAVLGATATFVAHIWYLESWAYPSIAHTPLLEHPGNLARSIGLLTFCFAGHPIFPSIHQTMRETQLWSRCIGFSYVVMLLYYGGLGVLGYAALGARLEPTFTANMEHCRVCRMIAIAAFLVKIQLTVPLLLRAIFVSLQLMPDSEKVAAKSSIEASPAAWLSQRPHLGPALLCTLTAASGCLLADKVAALASLTGSLLVMMTSVLIPVAVYLKLLQEDKVGVPLTSVCMCLAVLGCLGAVSGTYCAVVDLAAQT